MFTSKVWTDVSRLLQESNLAAEQPHRTPHNVIQAITSEGLAQGPYVEVESNQRPSASKAPTTTTQQTMPLTYDLALIYDLELIYDLVLWSISTMPINTETINIVLQSMQSQLYDLALTCDFYAHL